MTEFDTTATTSELKSMVADAQGLFHAASSATTDKAASLRSEGMRLLENALSIARDVQASTVKTGKEFAATADDYVHENPWRTVAVAAGVALIVGALVAPLVTRK
ncbi:MAG: hypothetical protein JWQ23_46 [Herminiimonas sp.]|nr:hypothetical protein [Herminiimonas sp.]